jgi:hypothetical protein
MSVSESTALRAYRVAITIEVLAGSEREAHSLATAAGQSLQDAAGIAHAWIDREAIEVES